MPAEEPSLFDLVEALRAEQCRRWATGECPRAEEMLRPFPGLLADAAGALPLLYNEVLLRAAAGDVARLDEYVQRFPQFAAQLPPLFEVHQALESGELLDPAPAGAAGAPPPVGGADVAAPWPRVAGYEVLAELGRGGMGVVYKARQVGLDRVVALKMISAAGVEDPARRARFRAEAHALAQLQHPHVVQIYEVGAHEGRPYFALEFLEGGSLAQRLDTTPQPARPAAALVRTLARAAHAGHEKGILHRDLKPANILFTPSPDPVASPESAARPGGSRLEEGIPKIADFGLAKQCHVGPGQTVLGTVLGTPSYMAPEQAAGRLQEVGVAADVYALGAILYEALTGRPPFRARTQLEALRLVLSEEPVPPARLNAEVPRDLETICLRCLDKDPRRRYPSALALAEDLERFLGDRPIRARRAGAAECSWRWCRRNPAVAALAGSLALLLLTLAVGATLAAVWLRDERDAARQAARDKADLLATSYLAQARAARATGRVGQRFESLRVLAEAAGIAHALRLPAGRLLALRNEALACLALPDVRPQRPLPGERPPETGLTFDPGLRWYAHSDGTRGVLVRRVADGQAVARLPDPVPRTGYVQLALSPCGRYLAAVYGAACPLVVWEWQQGRAALTVPPAEVGSGYSFTPDGARFAVGRRGGGLALYELPSGAPLRPVATDTRCQQVAFHPGGQLVALSTPEGLVQLRDTATDQVVARYPHPAATDGLAWRGDGGALAVGCRDHRIYVWDAARHRLLAELQGHQSGNIYSVFSHDGAFLMSNSWDGTTRLWDPESGRQILTGGPWLFQPEPANRRVAGEDGRGPALWELAFGWEYRALHHGPVGNRSVQAVNGPLCVDFSRDGRLLAAASFDGVRLWDPATGRELGHCPLGPIAALTLGPGGTLVAASAAGLHRWAVGRDGPGRDAGVRVGPREDLPLPAEVSLVHDTRLARDDAGRRLALTDRAHGRAIVYDLARPGVSSFLGPHPALASLAVSPDGALVATGTWLGAGVKVWDAATGALLKDVPCASAHAAFSPDGRWLVVGAIADVQLWRVGAWDRPAWVIPRDEAGLRSCVAFTPDSRLLACSSTSRLVRLVEVATGKHLATLEPPDPGLLSWLRFSPDGGRLAAATENHVVHLWDLTLVRAQLAEMRLDWDDAE